MDAERQLLIVEDDDAFGHTLARSFERRDYQVLRAASLFITHGGMNSVMEALSLGVPMVVAPQAADQFANAGRVAELGLGLSVGPSPGKDDLLGAADTVLANPGYRERTQAMQVEVTAGGGAERAAAAIHAFVGHGIVGGELALTAAV